jgi:hypothetical protein
VKRRDPTGKPLSAEEFAEAWDSLLRSFLLIANDNEWIANQKSFAGPSPLSQPFWSDAGHRVS